MILEGLLEIIGETKGLFLTAMLLTLIYYVFLTIAQWKLFLNAGEKGWKALIPFYNIFVSHHIIGMSHIWFILDIFFWVMEVVMEFFKTPDLVEDVILTVAIVLTLISEIIHIMKLCYCYTKSELFGIGLFLVPPLFSMILAFGKSKYHPPKSHRGHKASKNSPDTEH